MLAIGIAIATYAFRIANVLHFFNLNLEVYFFILKISLNVHLMHVALVLLTADTNSLNGRFHQPIILWS